MFRLVEPLRHGPKEPVLKKLYVGNLPFQATEEELGNWFNQTGVTPANVTLVRDRFTGQPRGFGFVEVNSDDYANRAIQSLNDHAFIASWWSTRLAHFVKVEGAVVVGAVAEAGWLRRRWWPRRSRARASLGN
jgi:RNA recognition motif-containing protein